MLIIFNRALYTPTKRKGCMARLIVADVDDLILTRLVVLLETNQHQLITTYIENTINQLPATLDADLIVGSIKLREHLLQFHMQHPRVPVIVVTDKPSIENAVELMQAGAYEYLDIETLTSRKLLNCIEAAVAAQELWVQQLSRLDHAAQIINSVVSDVHSQPETFLSVGRTFLSEDDYPLQIGELTLNPEENAVIFHERQANLSPTEFRILVELIRNISQVVTFEELALKLRGIPILRGQARRMFSAHISNLRKKLEEIDCHYVLNKRGEGYYLDVNRQEQPPWGFRQLKWIIDHALDAILLIDVDAQFSYASPSLRTVLGYEPEHFIGQHISNLLHIFHQDDRDMILQWLDDPRANPLETHIWRIRHQDGHYVWIEGTVNTMLDDDNLLFSAVMFWRDVSRRKASDDFLHSVVSHVGLLICRFDADLRCTFLNPLAEDYKFGDAQLVVGYLLSELSLPQDLQDKWQHGMESVFQSSEQQQFVLVNGSDSLDMRLIPEYDVNEQVMYVMCIAGGLPSTSDPQSI